MSLAQLRQHPRPLEHAAAKEQHVVGRHSDILQQLAQLLQIRRIEEEHILGADALTYSSGIQVFEQGACDEPLRRIDEDACGLCAAQRQHGRS